MRRFSLPGTAGTAGTKFLKGTYKERDISPGMETWKNGGNEGKWGEMGKNGGKWDGDGGKCGKNVSGGNTYNVLKWRAHFLDIMNKASEKL